MDRKHNEQEKEETNRQKKPNKWLHNTTLKTND